MKYNIALYIRLSISDNDIDGKKNESESINNQRKMLNSYIKSHKEISNSNVYEYHDDGFSGTNFERPDFQRLLRDVKQEKINCIIVKDFSRFGRDYIEIGNYLERIFPFMGVRFISVNDNYDSNDYAETVAGIDIAMKNVIYTYYSKDLSKKVIEAKTSKMKQGFFIGGREPFGYIRSPENKHKLIIDEETADVVKLIFKLACDGLTIGEITKYLNVNEIPTKAHFFRKRHPNTKLYKDANKDWNRTEVGVVLRNKVYLGSVVQGKRKRTKIGSSLNTIKVPEENQIIVSNMHVPIIDKEIFFKAQQVVVKYNDRAFDTEDKKVLNKYKGVTKCGNCKRALAYYGHLRKPYYICHYKKSYIENHQCVDSQLYTIELDKIVLQTLNLFFKLVDEVGEKIKANSCTKHDKLLKVKDSLELQIKNFKRKKLDAYEKYVSGKFSKADYLKIKIAINKMLDEAESSLEDNESEMNQLDLSNVNAINMVIDDVKAYRQVPEVTYELVQAFIDKIYVYKDMRIEIVLKHKDLFEKYIEN